MTLNPKALAKASIKRALAKMGYEIKRVQPSEASFQAPTQNAALITLTVARMREVFATSGTSVLFTNERVSPRMLKMAVGLRRKGWLVGLIYIEKTAFNLEQYFDFHVAAADSSHASRLVHAAQPRLCHVFTNSIDDFALQVCREKSCPVVIDMYDPWTPTNFLYLPERYAKTAECLRLSDACCSRDLRVRSARLFDQMRIPRANIIFPEYCINTPIPGIDKGFPADEIHVVSIGAFTIEKQGMYDSGYLQVIQKFLDLGIHFHLYPSWQHQEGFSLHGPFEVVFADYIALAKQSKLLHIHRAVSFEELQRVLPTYDFGMMSGACPEFGQRLHTHTPYNIRNCYSARLADYIDAGLPTIINQEFYYNSRILKHYGAFIDLREILRPGFKDRLLRLKNDGSLKATMVKAKERFSVDANTPRLIRFYMNVIEAGISVEPIRDVAEDQVCAKSHHEFGGGAPSVLPPTSPIRDNLGLGDRPAVRTERLSAMINDFLRRYTLIIPTYNRPRELSSLLTYLERQKAPFEILILDSGKDEAKQQNKARVAASPLNIRHLEYPQEIVPFKKMFIGSQEVRTEYCSLCADDDFVVIEAIGILVRFLMEHDDYSVAEGWSFYVSIPKASEFNIHEIAYANPSISDSNPLMRVRKLLHSYQSLTYGVYRTSVFKQCIGVAIGADDIWTHETLACALAVLAGKTHREPTPYYFRMRCASFQYDNWHPLEFLARSPENFMPRYLFVRNALAEAIRAKAPQIQPAAKVFHLVDLMYLDYFSEYLGKRILHNMFDNVYKDADVSDILHHGFVDYCQLYPSTAMPAENKKAETLVRLLLFLRKFSFCRFIRRTLFRNINFNLAVRTIHTVASRTVQRTTAGGNPRVYSIESSFLTFMSSASGSHYIRDVNNILEFLDDYDSPVDSFSSVTLR